MADRNLRVRIGLDTTGLTAAADAAAAAFGRVAAAAQAAGAAAQAGSARGAAAAATQAEAAKASAVTQEGLIRSTAQVAGWAAQAETDAAARTAAAQVAAAEAMAAAYEAAYRASALAASGASEAEIAAARSVVAAQSTAAAEAAASVKAAAAEETAAAEASAAAQVAAAKAVADAQAIAATAGTASARAAAAEARATSVATIAANRAAAAEATAAAGAVEGAAAGAAAGMGMKGMVAAAGLLLVGKSILTQTKDYELSMNTLQGVTGEVSNNSAAMQHASEVAKQLGADIQIPGASAADAAHAMLELVKAGFTLSQSETAAKASLQLAATAQVDAGKAAEFMGASLNMFGLNASDATLVADTLANTANAASGNITDFMYAMQNAAPAAHILGISLQDTSTFMGMLAKNGILGSNAGTEFARMLAQLEHPSKKAQSALDELGVSAWTADGKFVGLPTVIGQLSKAYHSMTPEAFAAAAGIAFGQHAVKAVSTVAAEGVTVWDDYSKKINVAGGNARIATDMMQGLPGALENIKNNASNLALTIGGGLSPILSGLLNGVAAVIGGFVDLPGPIQATAVALGAVILLRGPLMAIWASASTAIMGFGTAIMGFGATTRTVLAESGAEMGAFRAGMMAMAVTARGMFASIGAAIAANPLGAAIVGLTALWAGAQALGSALDGTAGSADATGTAISTLTGVVDTQTGALAKNAAAVVSDQLAHDGTIQKVQAAGVATGDYTAALLGNAEAQKRVEAALNANYTAAASAAGGIDVNTGAITGNSAAADAAAQLLVNYHEKVQAIQAAQASGAISAAQAAAAMQELGGSADGAVGPTNNLTGALKDGSVSAKELKTQVHDVMMQLDLLAGRNGDAEAAQRAFNSASRDFAGSQAAAAHGGGADRAAAQALVDQAKAQDDLNKAVAKYGHDSPEAAKAARAFADAQDSVASKNRDVQAAADNAAQKTADLQSAYLTAGQTAYNTARAHGSSAIATDAAAKAMAGLKQSFIDAQPEEDKVSGKAQALADKLFGIPTERAITISANTDPATTAIEMLNSLHVADKNFKITATTVLTGPLAGGIHIASPGGGAGTITKADGGIVQAANGLLREPMIARGGSNILWAEPETGWEAYISGKPSQLAANQRTLAIAAGRLGMSASVMGSDGASAPVITAHSNATHNVYNGGANVSTLAPVDNRVYNIHVTNTAQKPLTPDDVRYLLKQGERS